VETLKGNTDLQTSERYDGSCVAYRIEEVRAIDRWRSGFGGVTYRADALASSCRSSVGGYDGTKAGPM
jgi:hypothetical protein